MALFGKRKTAPQVDAARVAQDIQSRFNPISGLTPALLSSYLDSFDAGYLGRMAMIMDKIADRDDTLKGVKAKRDKSVSRRDWEVIQFDDSPEAQKQKEQLEYFYGALTALSAEDENARGGIKLLFRQMMDAVGKRYSVHEIVWKPSPDGITAEFRHVPLHYFEHTTSRLRFLESSTATQGLDMAEGEWLVTRGDGLMIACAILYMFKHLPLRDWVIYCEKYAIPGLHGKTDATKGSTQWNALRDALRNFNIDWSIITNSAASIDTIDVSARGELPHPKLVERCDRAMSALWRGGDLSTLSAGDSVGASLQADEIAALEEDDCELIEETLNAQVTPLVILYTRGTRALKAKLRINCPQRQDTKQELEVDDKLIAWGCPISKNDLLERYGRSHPDDGEELATPAARPAAPADLTMPNAAALLNAAVAGDRAAATRVLGDRRALQLQQAAVAAMATAVADDLQPLRKRIAQALANADDSAMFAELRRIQDELPDLLAIINESPRAATVLEDTMAAALLNGYAEGAAVRREGELPA